MSSSTPTPAPHHILRLHSSGVTCLRVSDDNERVYSGDDSGLVVVTSTRSLRPLLRWKAHEDGLLGIEEWRDRIITHARDNKLYVWSAHKDLPPAAKIGSSASSSVSQTPHLCYSMDVNALNYCRFSLLTISSEFHTDGLPEGRKVDSEENGASGQAFIALPNLVESSLADVWILPSCQRVHAAVGKTPGKAMKTDGRDEAGIIMSLHVFFAAVPCDGASSSGRDELRLLCAYENGSVTLRRYSNTSRSHSIEGRDWEVIWTSKLHVESVMSMRVSRDHSFAFSVSADHVVGRYNLTSSSGDSTAFRIKHAGHGSIAIRDDGKVCAIGGWDGKIRLLSTRTMKPLGTLSYHKQGCQAVEFTRTSTSSSQIEEDADEFDAQVLESRQRWLLGGSKDARVTIWALMDFSKGS